VISLAVPGRTQVIDFQPAGWVWMRQTLPSVFLALSVLRLNRWAVAAGSAVGVGWGTLMLVREHFDSPTHALGFPGGAGNLDIALTALIANVVVAVTGSMLANELGLRSGSRLVEADDAAGAAPAAPAAEPRVLHI
jgi:SSS family solute:Na+ symporter